MLSRTNKRRIAEIQTEIDRFDNQMSEESAKANTANEKSAIESEFLHEIFMLIDEQAKIRTDATLKEARKFPIAIPPRSDKKHWEQSTKWGHWQLTETGLEKLTIAVHEAQMRRFERFNVWFTPSIAMLALVVSVASLFT